MKMAYEQITNLQEMLEHIYDMNLERNFAAHFNGCMAEIDKGVFFENPDGDPVFKMKAKNIDHAQLLEKVSAALACVYIAGANDRQDVIEMLFPDVGAVIRSVSRMEV